MEYEEVYTTYYPVVYRFVYRRVNHPEDTQDITQEVFTRAYARYQRLEQKQISSYLYRIATNIMVDRYRRLRLRMILNVENCTLYAPDELEAIEYQDEADYLLEQIPEHRRIVFNLLADGYKMADIGRMLVRTYASVKTNVVRDRKVMYRHIDGIP